MGVIGNGIDAQRITVPPTQPQDANALGWDKVSSPAGTGRPEVRHSHGI